jgi:hypothetical protein
MLDFILTAAIFTVVGAVAVPLFPPLFRLAERIRAWLKFGPSGS